MRFYPPEATVRDIEIEWRSKQIDIGCELCSLPFVTEEGELRDGEPWCSISQAMDGSAIEIIHCRSCRPAVEHIHEVYSGRATITTMVTERKPRRIMVDGIFSETQGGSLLDGGSEEASSGGP